MPVAIKKILPPLLLVLLAGLLLLTAGIPYWLGGKAEQHFRRLADETNLKIGPQWQLQLLEYQRGLFASRAVTGLRLAAGRPAAPPEPGAPAELLITHHIWHGPLPLGGAEGWAVPPLTPRLAVINSRLSGRPASPESPILFRADTTITLGGRAETLLRLAPGSKWQEAGPAGLQLAWEELRGHLLYPVDLRSMQGELTLGAISLSFGPWESALDGLSTVFNYRLEEGETGNGTLAGSQKLAVERLRAGRWVSGPLAVEFNWRNLDRQALAKLLPLAPGLTGMALERGSGEISPPTAQTLVEALPRLLRASPVLEISRATLATPHGQASGRLRLAYLSRDDSRPFHPVMLLSGLEFELVASLPPPLLARLTGRRPAGPDEPGHPAGEPDGEELVQISYRAGELRINGRAAPIQTLLRFFR